MKKTLQEIYFNTIDNIALNSRLEVSRHKTAREQVKKDEALKIEIEKVFNSPEKYDVYYEKDTLKLCIDLMPETTEQRKNNFNRIDIQY